MKIVQATNDNLTELMSFYSVMCDVLGEKSFLPNGDKGGFPSQAMVEESIKGRCQFIGIEDNKIVAAYILNHDWIFKAACRTCNPDSKKQRLEGNTVRLSERE